MKASELIEEIRAIMEEDKIDDFEIGIQGIYELGLCDYPLPVADTGFMKWPQNLYALGVDGYEFLKSNGIDLLLPYTQMFGVDVYVCHAEECGLNCVAVVRENTEPPCACIRGRGMNPLWEKTDSNITLIKKRHQ